MSNGCEYCVNYKNLLYYNDLDGKGGGSEITLGIASNGWYLEVNNSSEKGETPEIMTGNPWAKTVVETPANYCPACGANLKEMEE